MKEETVGNLTQAVLGQKYAYATISLILGISCFVNLLGMEKGILAIVFGCLALKATPAPLLQDRRMWAKAGLALGSALLIFIPLIVILNFEELRQMIQALEHLSNTR